MKRLTACLFLVIAAAAFADDGSVLPTGVVRLRVIPSLTTVDQTFDADSGTATAEPSYRVTSVNAALEWGLTDFLTLGFKWAPGYKLASSTSDIPSDLSSNKKMELTGPEDLEIGTKILVVGKTGFVQDSRFRVAFTPGVSVPLDGYDAKEEFDRFADGKAYRPQSASAHGSVGIGMRSDLDWLLNDVFSVNVHNQIVQYLPREQVEFSTYAYHAGTAAQYGNAAADAYYPLTKTKTEWGLTYSFEVEPKAELDLGNQSSLTFGVPVVYDSHLKDKTTYHGTTTEHTAGQVLSVKPGVDYFVVVGPVPLEFKAEYSRAVWGKDGTAVDGTLAFQIIVYGKLY